MQRRTRTLIVLVVALAAASGATYIVYRAITRIPVVPVPTDTMFVVAAAQDLPTGTRLTREHVQLIGWPEAHPVKGAIRSIDAVVGRGLMQPVDANEPITDGKLAAADAGAGLPPSIPPGMRALSVRVNDVIGVAGFTVPGTRVDVLVTLRQGDSSVSRAIVSNVEVLTAGTRRDQELAKTGQNVLSTVVTLLVDPADAERIVLAQESGAITLTLRNPMDSGATASPGVNMTSLLAAPVVPTPPPPAGRSRRLSPPPAPVTTPVSPTKGDYTVQAIKAAKVTEEVVK